MVCEPSTYSCVFIEKEIVWRGRRARGCTEKATLVFMTAVRKSAEPENGRALQ